MLIFPVIRSLDKLPSYFDFLISAEVPQKFTFRFFASRGFSSSQDRDFVVLLKFLGFLSEEGAPTDTYRLLRSLATRTDALSYAISQKYGENIEATAESFVSMTNSDYKTAEKYAATLRVLQQFTKSTHDLPKSPITDTSSDTAQFSLVIPITKDFDVYDKLFAALFKHLKH